MRQRGRATPLLWLICCLVGAISVSIFTAPAATAAGTPGAVSGGTSSANADDATTAANKAKADAAAKAKADAEAKKKADADKDKTPAEIAAEQKAEQQAASDAREKALDPESIDADCDEDNDSIPEDMHSSWHGLLPASTGCGAVAAVEFTISKLNLWTSPDLLGTNKQTPNSRWFLDEYELVRAISVWMITPMFLIGIIHYVAHGKLVMILKMALVYLPCAVIAGVVSVAVVDLLIKITDDICQLFANSVGENSKVFFQGVLKGFGPEGAAVHGQDIMATILAIGLVLAAVVLYIVLLVRESAIYIAALFMPITLAMLVWPPVQKWFKKLAEFLFGMIISKIVMVAALSLMVAAFTAQAPQGASTANASIQLDGSAASSTAAPTAAASAADATLDQDSPSMWSWMKHTLTLIFMFFFIAFAPNAPAKLFANVSFDDTGGNQASMMNRPAPKRYIDFGNRMLGVRKNFWDGHLARKEVKNVVAAVEGYGTSTERAFSPLTRAIRQGGITSAEMNMTPARFEQELRRHGFERDQKMVTLRMADGSVPPAVDQYQALLDMSQSNNMNHRIMAHRVLHAGAENLDSWALHETATASGNIGGYAVIRTVRQDQRGRNILHSEAIVDTVASDGRTLLTSASLEPGLFELIARNEADYHTGTGSKMPTATGVAKLQFNIPGHLGSASNSDEAHEGLGKKWAPDNRDPRTREVKAIRKIQSRLNRVRDDFPRMDIGISTWAPRSTTIAGPARSENYGMEHVRESQA